MSYRIHVILLWRSMTDRIVLSKTIPVKFFFCFLQIEFHYVWVLNNSARINLAAKIRQESNENALKINKISVMS